MLTVNLANCGNPDHGQDPDKPMWGAPGPQKVEIKSLQDVSKKVREYIGEHELGAGNWSGGVVELHGQPIAYASYNGVLWTDSDWGKESHRKIEEDDMDEYLIVKKKLITKPAHVPDKDVPFVDLQPLCGMLQDALPDGHMFLVASVSPGGDINYASSIDREDAGAIMAELAKRAKSPKTWLHCQNPEGN